MDHERLPIEEERYLQAVTLCLDALGDHDFAKQIDESPPEIQPIAFKIYRAWSNEPKALLPRSTLTRSFHALINLSENLRAFSPPQMNSKSLRAIGQSLEVAKVTTFEIDKDSPCYILRSDSLTQSGEWILRNAVRQNDFPSTAVATRQLTGCCVSVQPTFQGLTRRVT